jgi:hypothetical protein
MKCQFTKPEGSQCNANAMTEADYCFSHNPDTRGEKEMAVRKGGLALKPRQEAEPFDPLPIRSIEGILVLIEDTMNRVRTEPMTHQKANCIGYLAGIALKAIEVGEIDEKLDLINSVVLERRTRLKK